MVAEGDEPVHPRDPATGKGGGAEGYEQAGAGFGGSSHLRV